EAAVGDALRLASALVSSIDGARIVLLSDGVFDPITDFSRGKAALIYKCIGKSDENLAITALGTADVSSGRQLYCGLKNTGAVALDPRVTLDRSSTVPDQSASKYDIVVFDGVPSSEVASRGVLSFGPVGAASPVRSQGSAKKPTFVSSEGDPLLKSIDFAGVY